MVFAFGMAAKDEDAIHVDGHDSLVYQFLEDVINNGLEHLRPLVRPKNILDALTAFLCPKICLPLVSAPWSSHCYISIDVQLGK